MCFCVFQQNKNRELRIIHVYHLYSRNTVKNTVYKSIRVVNYFRSKPGAFSACWLRNKVSNICDYFSFLKQPLKTSYQIIS